MTAFSAVRPSAIKLKSAVRFPARVVGGTAISVDKEHGTYTIGLDYSTLNEAATFDPVFVEVAIWNPHTDEWARVSLTDFVSISLPTTTQGDIIYRNAIKNTRLGAGPAGYLLRTGGTGANPTWADAATVRNDLGADRASPGSFWTDQGAANAKIFRIIDRIFLSDGALFDGKFNVGTSTGISPECKVLHAWAPREAAFWDDHRYGQMAIVGHSQSSKAVDNSWPGIGLGTITAIGTSGFVINDATVAADGHTGAGWGLYADAKRLANAGFTVGIEIAIANLDVTPSVVTPYNAKSGAASSVGIWLASGGGLDAIGYANNYGAVGHAAAAMVILSSFADDSTKFVKGIVFDDAALVDLSGGSNVYEAISLPQRAQIVWSHTDGTAAGFIWADTNSGSGNTSGVSFQANKVLLTGTGGVQAEQYQSGTFSNTGASFGALLHHDQIDKSSTLTTSHGQIRLYNPNGLVGQAITTGSSTSWATSSDARLKENFADFDAGAIIDLIEVYKFNWKSDGAIGYGPTAQAVHAVFPPASIPGSGEPGDEDFVPGMVAEGKFVALLLKEVKSLRERLRTAGL